MKLPQKLTKAQLIIPVAYCLGERSKHLGTIGSFSENLYTTYQYQATVDNFQGVVTPIHTILTAKMGVKKF